MNSIEQTLRKITESKNPQNFLIVLCSLIGALVIFQAGILVGFKKAEFSRGLGNNYYRAFERDDMMGGPKVIMGMAVPGGHGAAGRVVEVNLPTFIVAGPDNIEKVVRIMQGTDVRFFRDSGTSTDIKLDDMVVVIGNPNQDSEIEARLIRIVPAMPQGTSSAQW